MSFSSLQKQAFQIAERNSLRYDRMMARNYENALREIRAEIDKLNVRTLAGVRPDDYYNTVIKYNRLNDLLKQTTQIYNRYAVRTGQQVQQMSTQAMSETFYRQQYLLAMTAPTNISFSAISPQVVELSVTGTIEAWQKIPAGQRKVIEGTYGALKNYQPSYGTITDLLRRNRIEDLTRIQQAITSGFIQGKSVRNMAKDIRKVIDTSKRKAERIARTEFTRCANAGHYASTKYAESVGVDLKRMWVASLDMRTRPSHAALDGEIVGVDEPFPGGVMRPGAWGDPTEDINCRCTVIDLVDGVAPGQRRARAIEIVDGEIREIPGKTEMISFKNYNEWLEQNGIDPGNYKKR